MAKVYDFTPIELRPGVNPQDFENFFLEKYAPLGAKLRWKGYILKADRGEREGKYAAIWEKPSIENRNWVLPSPGQISEEALLVLGPEFDVLNQELDTYITGWPFTDYVELGGQQAERPVENVKGNLPKAKVYIYQSIDLHPGVKGEDFEKFFLEEYAPLGPKIAWYPTLLKGDRGEREGKYAAIWEIESVEARNRITYGVGQFTEDGQRRLGPDFQRLNEKYQKKFAQVNGTNYIELSR